MPRTALRQDITDARKRAKFTMGSSRELNKLQEILAADETVEALIQCRYEGCFGLGALTGTRFVFVCDGVMFKSTDEFSLDRIGAVQWQAVLGCGRLKLHVAGSALEFTGIYGPGGPALVTALRGHLAAQDRKQTAARDGLLALASQFAPPAPELLTPPAKPLEDRFFPVADPELLPQP